MSNIKVTVSYEEASTSKFDALMKEFEAAKQLADEQVAYYKPLADAAEDAKFQAILEQLETIKEYARRLAKISRSNEALLDAYLSSEDLRGYSGSYFKVICKNDRVEVKFDDIPFTPEYFQLRREKFCNRSYNIIADWDKLGIYETLEEKAHRAIKYKIEEAQMRGQNQIKRLNRVTGESNE